MAPSPNSKPGYFSLLICYFSYTALESLSSARLSRLESNGRALMHTEEVRLSPGGCPP